ncbi:MAG: hypothetical protein MJ193_01540 [Clostridia bacterium]|nr:hypothetical protein [Clostridia bacterium]
MANNTTAKTKKEPKLLLKKWFTPVDVTVEPEEPQKVIVAGLVEAKTKKEYPEGYFNRALAVFRGEYGTLFKTTCWFLIATILCIVVLAVGGTYFEREILGETYNFMANIGVGYPGTGDSISNSVADLYWKVYEPTICMFALAMIICTFFMAGQFYAAKRSFFQDYYKKYIRTFFMGVKLYWWKFFIGTLGSLVILAMGTSLLNLLTHQQLNAATAGDYCGVVFSFIFGAPILLVLMAMLSIFTVYKTTFTQTFKNAVVLIVNNPFTSIIVGVLSIAPIVIALACAFGTNPMIWQIVIYAAMVLAGCTFLALSWIAYANRGIEKCKAIKVYEDKKALAVGRKVSTSGYQGNPTAKSNKNKKKPNQPYQNPKQKKKK